MNIILYVFGVIATAGYMVTYCDFNKADVDALFTKGSWARKRFYIYCMMSCLLYPIFWTVLAFLYLKDMLNETHRN